MQDGNNNPAFKMQSSAISLSEKRVLKNAQNQPVCSLKKKVRSVVMAQLNLRACFLLDWQEYEFCDQFHVCHSSSCVGGK